MAKLIAPEWFDLNKYKADRNLTLAEWFPQLSARHLIFSKIKIFNDVNTPDWYKNMLSTVMDNIKENGLIEYDPESVKKPIIFSLDFKHFPEFYRTSCWSMSLTDIFDMYYRLGEWMYKDFLMGGCPVDLLNYVVNKRLSDAERNPQSTILNLQIDLRASNKKILDDLALLLNEMRETLDAPKPKEYTEIDHGKWSQYKLLPYLDLLIFNKLDNQEMTDRAIGELIYPALTNIDITARIRKTTRPLAMQVLNGEIVYGLAHQLEKTDPQIKSKNYFNCLSEIQEWNKIA